MVDDELVAAGDGRPVFTWSTALLPALALAALLAGSAAGPTSTADDRPAGRTVVELQVTDR
jgi:hypothetical protein